MFDSLSVKSKEKDASFKKFSFKLELDEEDSLEECARA